MVEQSSRATPGELMSFLLLTGVVFAGCSESGPSRYEVSGSVTFAGEKIEQGSIDFVPIGDTKGPITGANIQQGYYHIDRGGGPLAGHYRVEITALRKTGRQRKSVQQFKDVAPDDTLIDEVVNFIPAEYSGQTSQLVAEVDSDGKNVFNFDLKAD